MAPSAQKIQGKLKKGEGLVLVVDDEPIMRKIAVNVLKNSGYQVMAAEDGIKALDIYKQYHHKIKVVLLDLLMPIKSGKDTFIEMKKINPGISAILVTGADRDIRIKELLKMGIKAYIEKPYSFPYLSQTVFNVINNSGQ